MSSGMRRIPATEASAKASGDSMNPETTIVGPEMARRIEGDPQERPRRAPTPGRAGGSGDDDAHQIEADQNQETGQGQKAEADKMAKRRGFPCQAKRVALDDGSQGQLQRREFMTEAEPSASRAKRDLVLRILGSILRRGVRSGTWCRISKGFAVSISVSDLARRPLVAPHLPPMSPS